MTTEELLVKHFKPSPDYPNIIAWRIAIARACELGCDWLEHFVDRNGVTAGDAVVRLCAEIERKDAEIARLRKELNNIDLGDD